MRRHERHLPLPPSITGATTSGPMTFDRAHSGAIVARVMAPTQKNRETMEQNLPH